MLRQSKSSIIANTLNMKKKDPIDEARRYVDNAKTVLAEKAEMDVETQSYQDPKYVRAAGNYLWLGVLQALDAVFHVRKDRRTRVAIDDYTAVIGQRDHKLLDWVNSAYLVMHLNMNYDGVQDKGICQRGVHLANEIIDRCASMYKKG